jgi:hypothetical protein
VSPAKNWAARPPGRKSGARRRHLTRALIPETASADPRDLHINVARRNGESRH